MVAQRFKKAFEKKGWECDLFKITKKITIKDLPDYKNYDFLCLGSPVEFKLPTDELMAVLNPKHGPFKEGGKPPKQEKVIFNSDSKKGVAFATFSGHHLGPKEPDPALVFMESMIEHSKFQCVGKFACPGKMFDHTQGWYEDLDERPNERDLQKAEIFIEEIIENYY
jgi:flavodoxin